MYALSLGFILFERSCTLPPGIFKSSRVSSVLPAEVSSEIPSEVLSSISPRVSFGENPATPSVIFSGVLYGISPDISMNN